MTACAGSVTSRKKVNFRWRTFSRQFACCGIKKLYEFNIPKLSPDKRRPLSTRFTQPSSRFPCRKTRCSPMAKIPAPLLCRGGGLNRIRGMRGDLWVVSSRTILGRSANYMEIFTALHLWPRRRCRCVHNHLTIQWTATYNTDVAVCVDDSIRLRLPHNVHQRRTRNALRCNE